MADTLPLHYPPPTITVVGPEPPLTRLIHRLEAATSRLEDIACSANPFDTPDGAASKGLQTSNSTPELPGMAGSKSASASTQVAPSAPAVSLPATLSDMDTLMSEDVSKFVSAAEALDDSSIAQQVYNLDKHMIDSWLTVITGTRSLTRLCRSAQVSAHLDQG